MRRLIALVLAIAGAGAIGQEAPVPEQCRAVNDRAAAVTVTHGGTTYRLANEACRAQFLSDPERYAQLYEALAELEAEGTQLVTASPSLVPS